MSAEAVCELQATSRMVNRLIPRHISYPYQEKLVGLDGGGSVKVSTVVEAVRLSKMQQESKWDEATRR